MITADEFSFRQGIEPAEVTEIPLSGTVITPSITSFLARIPDLYLKAVRRSYLMVDGHTVIQVRYAKQMERKSVPTLRRLMRSRVPSIRDSALYELARRQVPPTE